MSFFLFMKIYFKEKSLYYFHKKLRNEKEPKKKTFLVGFFRVFLDGFFGWVFLGGFFLLPTLP
jgi:hypothetical protein